MAVAARTKIARKRLTREESLALTREKILASAYDVMAREGYEAPRSIGSRKRPASARVRSIQTSAARRRSSWNCWKRTRFRTSMRSPKSWKSSIDPREMIDAMSKWSVMRARNSSWGMLALDLFRRAKHDATFGDRHAHLFRKQWTGLGEILLKLFPKGQRQPILKRSVELSSSLPMERRRLYRWAIRRRPRQACSHVHV